MNQVTINFSNLLVAVNFAYLVSIILFILGIKLLSSPKTARRGNRLSAVAMLVAAGGALYEKNILNGELIILAAIIGAVIGLFFAYKVQMTQMPEMVALFNGFGGGASTLVASAEVFKFNSNPLVGNFETYMGITISLSIIIGAITFTGSLIAFGKLFGIVSQRPVTYIGQKVVNALLFVGLFGSVYMLIHQNGSLDMLYAMIAISLVLGVTMVLPIGGADMPVVISLLNSYSGLAAAATGFVLNNYVLIVAGALVGASGIILTNIMCVAMNRSLTNVLFGAFGAPPPGSAAGKAEERAVKSYSVDDAIIQFEMASSVVVVPGYGLAVAQAQHTVRELAEILEARGVDVKYAIHPVAGRMPGHMNVLLAEANVDYDKLVELDEINPAFETTDVVLVVGANDVINPAAKDDKASPIYGMPILDVSKAQNCIILKRSMASGFAGIENELFYSDKTMMIFGDAKKTLVAMLTAAKNELV